MSIDPVTGLALSKGSAYLLSRLSNSALERWSRYRAEKFFDAFLAAYEKDTKRDADSEETLRFLLEILEDDQKSEILYDAYRAVCLAKTRTFGPRIIGFLTATLVNEGRIASDEEEKVFRAAEQFADRDFSAFLSVFEEEIEKNGVDYDSFNSSDRLEFLLPEVKVDHNDPNAEAVETSPLSLDERWGAWASRAEQIGLLRSATTQRTFTDPSIGSDVSYSVYRFRIYFEKPCFLLKRLTKRAMLLT